MVNGSGELCGAGIGCYINNYAYCRGTGASRVPNALVMVVDRSNSVYYSIASASNIAEILPIYTYYRERTITVISRDLVIPISSYLWRHCAKTVASRLPAYQSICLVASSIFFEVSLLVASPDSSTQITFDKTDNSSRILQLWIHWTT